MKTKRKEKEKKKEEKKRKEAKRIKFFPDSNSNSSARLAKALPLGHVECTGRSVEILLLKPSSLMKHEFKKIFFRRMTAVWTVKTQRKSISSHLRVKNGSPTV